MSPIEQAEHIGTAAAGGGQLAHDLPRAVSWLTTMWPAELPPPIPGARQPIAWHYRIDAACTTVDDFVAAARVLAGPRQSDRDLVRIDWHATIRSQVHVIRQWGPSVALHARCYGGLLTDDDRRLLAEIIEAGR